MASEGRGASLLQRSLSLRWRGGRLAPLLASPRSGSGSSGLEATAQQNLQP